MQRKEKFPAAYAAMLALTLMFLAVSALYAAHILSGASDGTTYLIETEYAVTPEPLPERALININTATVDELTELSGIGPALAQAIVDEREANGPFASADELRRVSGIGEKKVEALRGEVCTEEPGAAEPDETEEAA